jgi:hypothetical protein
MKKANILPIALIILALSLLAPAVQAQQPRRCSLPPQSPTALEGAQPLPEPEYLFYMPYVAKQLWEVDSVWIITDLRSNDGVNYYATLVSDGWTVEGKNVQAPSWAYIVPAVGVHYLWKSIWFWSPTSSWHPPFYMDFYAVRIITRPDE